MGHRIWRTLVVLHRYLGVAVGVLMLVWFLSGIVMMYVGFPELTEAERLRALAPITWQSCCHFGEGIDDKQTVTRAQLESLAGEPVLQLRRIGRRDAALDLATGAILAIDADRARAIALDAATRIMGSLADPVSAETVASDQWTVGHYFRDRPLYRFAFNDSARTTIYVSSTTGQTVLWTTAMQRFWNWLGAIPHWLYLEALRGNAPLWSQVVIWTSILGTFLTVIGIALGIVQFRRGAGGALSPYRGLFLWHHLAGLTFGLVTLAWVFSGLVSMNPWGFLEGRRGGGEQARLEGNRPAWSEVRASLDEIRKQPSLMTAVNLVTAPFDGKLYWLATQVDRTRIRLDAAGNAAPLSSDDLVQAAERIASGAAIASQGLMTEEDAYYFRHSAEDPFPVYRVILGDKESTRYYLDPVSGVLLQRADAAGRWHRWLFGALHRWDFATVLRVRPFWDIVMLVFMAGGIGLTGTGCWLALRRIRGDLANAVARLSRRKMETIEGHALPTDETKAPPG